MSAMQSSSITQYSPYELVQLIQCVSSDGQLRTDDEIVTERVSGPGIQPPWRADRGRYKERAPNVPCCHIPCIVVLSATNTNDPL